MLKFFIINDIIMYITNSSNIIVANMIHIF